MNWILTALILLQATMDDPAAVVRSVTLWGNLAHIAQVRGPFDTYWEKQVGVMSVGCQNDFVVLGRAANTWDAAFASVPPNAIVGPYSGVLTLKARAHDDVAMAGVQVRLDGANLGPELTQAPAVVWDVQQVWNSAGVPNGIHTLCAVARDTSNNIGRGLAFVFRVDQGQPTISQEIKIP